MAQDGLKVRMSNRGIQSLFGILLASVVISVLWQHFALISHEIPCDIKASPQVEEILKRFNNDASAIRAAIQQIDINIVEEAQRKFLEGKPLGSGMVAFENNAVLSLPRDPLYSSVFCYGGEKQECWAKRHFRSLDWSVRRCIMRNVQVGSDGRLVFYEDAKNMPLWDFNYGRVQFGVDAEAINQAYGMRIHVIPRPVPNNVRRKFSSDSDHCVVMFKEMPSNAVDPRTLSVFSLFEGLAGAHMLKLTNEVVLLNSTTFNSSRWRTVSSTVRTFESFVNDEVNQLIPYVLFTPGADVPGGFSNEIIARVYRDRALALLDIGALSQKRIRPRIGVQNLLLSKQSLVDVKSFLDNLRQWCDTRCDVEEGEITEVEVYITSMGEVVDFASVFVPQGSTVIYSTFSSHDVKQFTNQVQTVTSCSPTIVFDETHGWRLVNAVMMNCLDMRDHVFTSFPHFFKDYLFLGPATMTSHLESTKTFEWRNIFAKSEQFQLEFKQVTARVEAALARSGWTLE